MPVIMVSTEQLKEKWLIREFLRKSAKLKDFNYIYKNVTLL